MKKAVLLPTRTDEQQRVVGAYDHDAFAKARGVEKDALPKLQN